MENAKTMRDAMASRPPVKIQERAFQFSVRIVTLHKTLLRSDETARVMGRQLLRCGTSIGANLEEADGAQSRKDFIMKCNIALKEANEARYWLRLLVAADVISAAKLAPLIQESTEIIAILTTIIKKARANLAKP